MEDEVRRQLAELTEARGVQVLYACESGSRAWGFASPDSDYDVRFIYAHDVNWYLQVFLGRDTIDLMLPHDLDLSGWELRKTLQLFAKSNVALLEWLRSPVVYLDDDVFRPAMAACMADFFSPRAAACHYLGLAKKTVAAVGDDGMMTGKKLLYALRAVMAATWIRETHDMPPVPFGALYQAPWIETSLHEPIAELLAHKAVSNEATTTSVPPILGDWLHEQLALADPKQLPVATRCDMACLDKILRRTLQN